MATALITQGARTQISGAAAALANLASTAFGTIGTITHNSAGKAPLDCLVELSVTPGTVAGNKQAILYAQASLDGTNFSSGPASGAVATDEANLIFIGVLPLGTNAALQSRVFSLAAAFGGVLPYATRLIVKNDSGAALAASGHDAYRADQSGDVS
jgi:hypothetical protein